MALAMAAKNRVRKAMCDSIVDGDELEELDRHPLLVHHRRPRKLASLAVANSSRLRSIGKSDGGGGGGSSILSCVGLSGGKRGKNLVTVVVGEEQRAFRVEPQILDHGVVQCLLEKTMDRQQQLEEGKNTAFFAALEGSRVRRSWSLDHDHRQQQQNSHLRSVIRVDCDAILFEHILWLLGRDDPSLRHLNLDELMEFYS